ncbi:unnamed protein product [Rhizopus stolonifer]
MFDTCIVTPLKRKSKSLDDIKQDKLFLHCRNLCMLTTPINHIPRPDIPRRRHSLDPSHHYSRLATIYGWITTTALTSITNDSSPSLIRDSNTSHIPKEPIENDPHVFDLLYKDALYFIHYGKSDSITVTSATVEKLVEKLTREMDHDFLMDFFLTFRQFVTPIKLCKLLISRFRWTLLDDTEERQWIRIRTFVVIRHWLTHYWTFDFIHSRTLRFMLSTFLTQLRTHTVPCNERIVKSLRRVLKRQRRFHRQITTTITATEKKTDHIVGHFFRCKLSQTRWLFVSHQSSIVLRYRSETIAQQFCLIERDMLQMVGWDELVELRWRKKGKRYSSLSLDTIEDLEGVERLIEFFNKTCQWVAFEVVSSRLLETRVRMVEKFIRIAYKCYQHRNYSTLMQILLGLQSPAVTRLERTWERVDGHQKDLLDQLKELAKPFKNWKNVRECMTKATEEVTESFAVECVLTQSLKEFDHVSGCIPFLGLYLSDLVFLAELPTFVDSTADVGEEEKEKELCERLCNHLVNYNKFRITGKILIIYSLSNPHNKLRLSNMY